MKAQDKIYVPIVNLGIEDGEHPAPLWWNKDKKSEHSDVVGTIEYIRKEAILEWAKKRKEQAGIGLSEYDMGHENGICEVIEELIKHIESL